MTPSRVGPLHFTRGRHAYVVGRACDGDGYIGLRDGRIVACDLVCAQVARALIIGRDLLPAKP